MFVSRGCGHFSVWFGAKPKFIESVTHDENGNLMDECHWRDGHWAASEGSLGMMRGSVFFNHFKDTELFEDVWAKVVNSYIVDAKEGWALYSGILEGYDNAIVSKPRTYHEKSLDEKLESFLNRQKESVNREKAIEHPGMGWRELVMEYDVQFDLVDAPKDEKHCAWITKEYNDIGFTVHFGKDKPYFRHAMVIDPCFSSALKAEDRRSARYESNVRTDIFPIASVDRIKSAAKQFIEPAFVNGLSSAVLEYNGLVCEFIAQFQSHVDAVETKDDYLKFCKHPELVPYSEIDLIDGMDYVWFQDITPNELASAMLDVMARAYARNIVDAKDAKFDEWVKPVRINLSWCASRKTNK